MKPAVPNRKAEHDALVLTALKEIGLAAGPSEIARFLEAKGTHWWAYSTNCRVLVYAILQRVKAVRHPGGKFTSPV